ncbi:DUF3306 domain-containing protein [Qingshengfaniella alkalisoli]|uniref:DUF3306 domain-containing protein n=1 Tax=Qingshengfaniella alkalisoli TaxID=2599296 RepID=A0A5B8I811_9RHOB|nr:DUF3306 domain-containing protein [Qingshengfaniella alkalisoli]QDY69799.1 DUF3306 domain-containing protein [Qingshengfaniella alkalisoli]
MTHEDFLTRWSRRKREPATPEAPDDALPAVSDEELETNRKAAEDIDLTSLTRHSDLSVFFKAGVPHLLRNRALATVWRGDPVFANLDGLVDHAEDFHDPKQVQPGYKSAWEAGKGYAKRIAETLSEPEKTAPSEEVAQAEPSPSAPVNERQGLPETEDIPDDADTMPKVSLRHRLGLDTA